MTRWLLDCGNTRWKWATADDLGAIFFSEPGQLPDAALPASRGSRQLGEPEQSSPSEEQHGATLVILPTAARALELVAAMEWVGPRCFLGTDRPGCAGYATHGLDRQAGGFAVCSALQPDAAAIVLDAGTAVTADVWRADAGHPSWCGGWILPGSRVAMQGLAAAAPALPVAADHVASVTAVSSAAQLAVGPQFGWPLMVQALLRQLIAELGLENAKLLLSLTGGDAAAYRQCLVDGPWRFEEDPQLVMRGMRRWSA